jgi:hypothetical protein
MPEMARNAEPGGTEMSAKCALIDLSGKGADSTHTTLFPPHALRDGRFLA